jgi:acetamidase/formamidase
MKGLGTKSLVLLACLFLLAGGTGWAKEGKTHTLLASLQTTHTGFFDASIAPVLTINSGDTVIMNSMMLMDGQLKCGMTFDELLAKRQTYIDRKMGPHTLTGPIFVKGAQPGDVLEVRIKKLVPADCGVNYHFPSKMNIGGLPEDFPNGQFKTIKMDIKEMRAEIAPGVVIPLNPFFGVMGLAPKEGEKRPAGVPDSHGGNIDNKEMVAGTKLYLPVSAPGGLFSAGDAHGAQGDGEVNVTAIETAMREAILQFVVRKDMKLERPMGETKTHWIAMAFHKDLNEAVKIAIRDAVQFISKTKKVTPDDAYAICSMAVDFRVTQVVDGNKGIHAMIPKAIFKKK